MEYIEIYKLYRDQIQHEDNLINQRATWLVGSQSFLLTGYIFLVNQPLFFPTAESGRVKVPGADDLWFNIDALLHTIGTVRLTVVLFGLLTSVCVAAGIYAALMRIRQVIDDFVRNHGKFRERSMLTIDIIVSPTITSKRWHRAFGSLPSLFLGSGYITAWLVLLLQTIGVGREFMLGSVVTIGVVMLAFLVWQFAGTKQADELR